MSDPADIGIEPCPNAVEHRPHGWEKNRRSVTCPGISVRSVVDLALDTRSAHDQRSGGDRRAWDHPQHYGGADNPYEAIKVIEAWELDFCLGNTVKYVSRAGKKDPAKEIEDLEKARWYLDRRIQQLSGATASQAVVVKHCGRPDDHGSHTYEFGVTCPGGYPPA